MKHAYTSCEWELLKRFSRPEVKGQGHGEVKCTSLADGYPSTYGRPSVVHLAEAYKYTDRRLFIFRPHTLQTQVSIPWCVCLSSTHKISK